MDNYKSWSGLSKQLKGKLCDSLKDRISYFLTRYHDVHNSYGRAAILLDGKELVNFTWIEMYRQETDIALRHIENSALSYECLLAEMKPKWDLNCTYNEMDFLEAALIYRNKSIHDALESENYLVKIFAIIDKRLGQRTLQRIAVDKKHEAYPEWVRQFYDLRFSVAHL